MEEGDLLELCVKFCAFANEVFIVRNAYLKGKKKTNLDAKFL